MELTFRKAPFIRAYTSIANWLTLEGVIDMQKELNSPLFDKIDEESLEKYGKYPTMWVCASPIQAFRHMDLAIDLSLSNDELKQQHPDWRSHIDCVASKNLWIIDNIETETEDVFLVIDIS